MDLGWIAERTNFGDAISVAAYGLSFALLESLLFFGLMVLAGFLFPKSWPEPQRISVLGMLILLPLIWAILGQLYFLLELSAPIGLIRFLAGQAHPLWLLYGGLGLVVGPTVALAVFAALRLEKFQKGFLDLADRLGVLMGLYIFLDLVSIIIVIVLVVLVVALAALAVGAYNGLIRLRNLVQEAWRQIDVELTRRHDLIGNLVETVKGYAAHERGTLEDVMRARSAAMVPNQSPAQQAESENILSQALGRLIAVAEAYPDLKANENFMALQAELTSTEDRIASARRYYNATVRDLNTKVETVPTNIIAGMFSIERAEYFEAVGEQREVPRVDFGQRDATIPPPESYRGSEPPARPSPDPTEPPSA